MSTSSIIDHRVTCYANDCSGNSEMGPNLYPKVPDMRLAETQNLTDGELFYNQQWSSSNWNAGLGQITYSRDTWKLVLFIRRLSQLSAEDKKQMLKFNPKSWDAD